MNQQDITLTLNGQPQTFRGSQLSALLAEHTRATQSFAVAVNGRFVPRTAYNSTTLGDGDRVEILIPMQGG